MVGYWAPDCIAVGRVSNCYLWDRLQLRTVPPFVTVHYVLRISGYSCFLMNLPPNTTTFLGGLWQCGKSRSKRRLSESKKKIRGTRAFFRDNWAEIWKEIAIHSLYFNAVLGLWLLNYLWKMGGYPHFSFWILVGLAKICFFSIVITFAKVHLYLEAPSFKQSY